MSVVETLFVGTFGAALYGAIEVLWRGHTHWTMLITGGVAFAIMYLLATRSGWPLPQIWLCSAAVITTLEFVTGIIVNIRLGWGVWDYSDQPFNLFGQICLLYSLLWFLLAIPGTSLCSLIKRRVF